MHLHGPSSAVSSLSPANVSWVSFFIVYSIPVLLVLTIACIIKWRPFREFPNFYSLLCWYCSCSAKKIMEELEQTDRTHMVMPIDAQSLASLSTNFDDSPLLIHRDPEDVQMTAIP